MLDEVIQYMKQLQAQVQMMNWMKMYTSMMLPITMQQQQQQQQLKMSMMMAQMGMGMGMSKDMVMNMNSMNIPGFPPMLPFPSFMPMAPCGDQLQVRYIFCFFLPTLVMQCNVFSFISHILVSFLSCSYLCTPDMVTILNFNCFDRESWQTEG